MLQKSKSKRILQLKYLLLIPMVGSMLFYASCSDQSGANATQEEANLTSSSDTEVMNKINELSEAIMKKGNLTDEEMKALKFLATEAQPGDKVYESVQDYLDEEMAKNAEDGSYLRNVTVDYVDNVPFAVIGKAPLFPGCDGMTNEAGKKCTIQKIAAVVAEEFNTKLANSYDLTGRQRISVQFKIDNGGNVTDVKARAAHPALEQEGIRVVKTLPKMTPGKHKGKAVAVLYSLPIIFEVE